MGWFFLAVGKKLPLFKKIKKNIELSSLKIPSTKLDMVSSQVLDNFGRYIAEFQFIHNWDKKEFSKYVTVVGEENLKNANKVPSMILTSHLANWEVIVRYFYFKKNNAIIINRPMNNQFVNKILFKYRSNRTNFEYVDKNSASKKIIEAINNKALIGMLADVKLQGKLINFLGRKAQSSDIVARLHEKHKMQIIPTKVERYQKFKFKITFYPPVTFDQDALKNKDYEAMTIQIHKIYESWIAQNPGQWFWLHNRWKIN